MTRRLLSYDPISGVAAWHEHDEVRDETTITHTFDDVDLILDNNKLNYNHVNGWSPDRTVHKVATIPLSIIAKWMIEDGVDPFAKENAEWLKKKLNDPEWRYLRTSPGKL